jgi:hypothetical protein
VGLRRGELRTGRIKNRLEDADHPDAQDGEDDAVFYHGCSGIVAQEAGE